MKKRIDPIKMQEALNLFSLGIEFAEIEEKTGVKKWSVVYRASQDQIKRPEWFIKKVKAASRKKYFDRLKEQESFFLDKTILPPHEAFIRDCRHTMLKIQQSRCRD